MRITEIRFPIIAAIVAAIFLCSIPENAEAQATTFNAQNCSQQHQNAFTNTAQARTANISKIFQGGPLPSMKLVYCWNKIIVPMWNLIGTLTSAANGANALGAAIWGIIQTILSTIITSVINAICATAAAAMASAISWIKNLFCLPLPHFALNFAVGGFGGRNCNGINLLTLAASLGGARNQAPGAWGVWGLTKQY